MTKINLRNSFKEFCIQNKFEINEQQAEIIDLLNGFINHQESFLSRFFKKKNKLCFYLYGNVGVGKTMLLDYVYSTLKMKKLRQHFNEFMIKFHDFRHEKKDGSSINAFVENLKKKFDLIYLDEFQVTNIVDAMILGKLFEVIFDKNIKIIITTNIKLDDLYKDGLQRNQFLPFITIIRNFSIEKKLEINEDYRTSNNKKFKEIFFPLNEKTTFKINQRFRELTKGKNQKIKIVKTKGRDFEIKNFYSGVAKFKFKDLCDRNLGAEDFINISKICYHIFIEDVPSFNNENSNQQLRFITLIDILYEKKIKLTLSLEENLDNFGSSNKHHEVFKRTVSRMFEMTKSP